jgi:Rrf2 family cysteine metabolism transcriptional repressor
MMAISTRGRYATRIMVLLASRHGKQPMTKYDIGAAEEISPAYVQQLMTALRLAGLVATHRGRQGGFSLTRPPESVTVADVLKAVEGDVMPAPCRTTGHCQRANTCPTRPIWEKAAQLLEDLFTGTSIADLAAAHASTHLDSAPSETRQGR